MKDIKLYENTKSQLILQERLYKPINSIQRTIVQQTASAASCIAIYDQPTGCFTQLFHYGSAERDLFQELCNEKGPAHISLLNQQPLLLSEHSTESPSAAALLKKSGMRYALFLPLCDESQCFGVLSVVSSVKEGYSEQQHELLRSHAQLLTAVLSTLPLAAPPGPHPADSDSRSDFLMSMNNEIRAPLNHMLGMLSLLKQTRLTLEQQEYLDMSQNSGDELLRLLNDVLDISRIDAGKLELENIKFDLRHLVEDLLETFSIRAQQKQLELANIIFASVPKIVSGDPARLRQILTNLLTNVIRYTGAGEVVVTVFPVEEDEKGILVGFEIKDTGTSNVSDEQLPLLGTADGDGQDLWQADSTGIGLVVSRELAEHMGGEIGVEETSGNGCTFWFTARFGHCEERPEEIAAPVKLSSIRALIVNNNPTSCAVIEQMFLACGMCYEGVPNGAAALQALRRASDEEHPYELVIMEIALPDMSGFELSRCIEDTVSPGSCRKIMLASHGKRGDAESARKAGLQAYITGPVRGTQMRDVIERVMGLNEDDKDALITRYSLSESSASWQYRILIVEDDIIIQKILLAMLKKLGLRADIAHNGMDAVSAVRDHRYDIVLMDIQMPEMNGYEATAAIRELEQTTSTGQNIPVIALTGNALAGDRERYIDAGMDDYITKPVTLEQLKGVLSQWLPADAGSLAWPGTSYDGVEHTVLNADPLDRPTFDNLRQSLGQEFENVIAIYLDDARKRIKDMNAAVASANSLSLNHAAHTLKSASRYIGILQLADLCNTVEKAADKGDQSLAASVVPLIGQVFDRAEIALHECLTK